MKIDILSVSHRERLNSAIKHQLIVQAKYNGSKRERTTNEMEIGLCLRHFLFQELSIKSKAFYARDFSDVVLYNYHNFTETYFKIEPVKIITHYRINPENDAPDIQYTGNSRIIVATPNLILSSNKKEYHPVCLLEDFISLFKGNFKYD